MTMGGKATLFGQKLVLVARLDPNCVGKHLSERFHRSNLQIL